MKRLMIVLLVVLTTLCMSALVCADEEGYLDPLAPWHVVVDEDISGSTLDAISYEWEYFMIHDPEERFVGIVGYLIANPREKLSDIFQLVPMGGNMAFVGELDGAAPTAEFISFGSENTDWSEDDVSWEASDIVMGHWGAMTPIEAYGPDGVPAVRLQGATDIYEWDLVVTQAWSEIDPMRTGDEAFTTVAGPDVGLLPCEKWTVDALWPATKIEGEIIVRSTGEVIPIAGGKGYRENSYGMYALSADGWDFMVMNDFEEGVLGVWQSYHKSEELDFFDLAFYDDGELVTERFRANRGELGWIHDWWNWDSRTRQCVPTETRIKAKNSRYSVEIEVEIGDRQEALLSSATLGTEIFFIQEQFPTVFGVIKDADGDVIQEFETQAGGEFAFHRSLAPWHSNFYCTLANRWKFYQPFPR